ncbi:hypothetical protein QBE52_10190 [Clostridiaceae bacterium 35-E11]
MRKKISIIITMIVLLSIILTSLSYAEQDKKVVLIVMNETNYEELYSIESVRKLIDNGAAALMNNRTSTKANTYKAYVSIGAGTRAEGSSDTTLSMNVNNEIQSIYARRTGLSIRDTGIINVDIAKLIRQNDAGEYGATPGALGKALHDMGMKTAALGNADTKDIMIRLAPAIAMDNNGYIDYGDIGQGTLVKEETYPFGLKSNYPKQVEIFKDLYDKADFITVEIGDIGRLERYKDNLTDEMYALQKSKIQKDIDRYIGDLLNIIDSQRTRIILVTPYPSSVDIKSGNKLTPAIFYGDGVKKGLLTSGTTRRTGIIGNVDIAPSIAAYLGANTTDMSGKPIQVVSNDDQFEMLRKLNGRVVSTSQNRYPVLSTFAIFEILISIAALIIILIQNRLNDKIVYYFKNLLLSTMTVPFVLLILPLFHVQNLFMTYVFLAGAIILITYTIKKMSNHELDGILILSFLTTASLLIDLCTNGNLIKNSLLGYDPIIGARYYGIGNEYMGVLIGSTLVFATGILDRFKISKFWTLLVFLGTIFIIGYPKLGANVGGTITAVAAFIFVGLRLLKIRITLKQLFLIGIAVIGVVGFMAFIDIKLLGDQGQQSHLAGAIQQIIQEGPIVIFLIIKRKIAMNLKLIGITIWSKVLITTIIILAILFYRPVGTLYKLIRVYANLAIGWSGIIVACVVAFFVNDSGVVAAATGIIFLAMSMLYLTFVSHENSKK